MITRNIFTYEPTPEINGYTITNDAEFNILGAVPNLLVWSSSMNLALKNWLKFTKLVEKAYFERIEQENLKKMD